MTIDSDVAAFAGVFWYGTTNRELLDDGMPDWLSVNPKRVIEAVQILNAERAGQLRWSRAHSLCAFSGYLVANVPCECLDCKATVAAGAELFIRGLESKPRFYCPTCATERERKEEEYHRELDAHAAERKRAQAQRRAEHQRELYAKRHAPDPNQLELLKADGQAPGF